MGKHIHGRPITLIVTSLIEYILIPIQIIYLWLLTLIILSNAFHVVQIMCIYHIIPYLSHILCLLLVICFYHILDLFHIIYYIIFFASFLYFHVHFLSCSYTMHVSYTFISHILSYNLSYTVLYFYLHPYTFHIRYFCMLSSVFHLFLVFFIFQFYDLLHSMYYYIYHFLSCTYIMSPFM